MENLPTSDPGRTPTGGAPDGADDGAPSRLQLGTGPVDGAEERHAPDVVAAFLADLDLDGASAEREPPADGEGRYGYTFTRGARSCLVAVPGLPVERVRYVRGQGSIWGFPRLVVGSGTWAWPYAIAEARKLLAG